MITVSGRSPSWQEDLKKNWPELCEALASEFPFLQGCREDLSYEAEEGNCICITVPSPFLLQLLEQKMDQLEDIFSRSLGIRIQVRLKAVEKGLEKKWRRIKEQRSKDQKYLTRLQQKQGARRGRTPPGAYGETNFHPPDTPDGTFRNNGGICCFRGNNQMGI